MPMMPPPTCIPPQPQMDPAAYLQLQRQQAEQAFQQAWQNLTVLSEMSRQREDASELQSASPPCPNVDGATDVKKAPEKEPEDRPQASAAAPKQEKTTGDAVPEPPKMKPEDEKTEETKPEPPPSNQVLVRIRRVGTFDTGDGKLEIFARWTEHGQDHLNNPELHDRASQAPTSSARGAEEGPPQHADGEPWDVMKPKPKRMPVVKKAEVTEPPYPPRLA